MLLLLGGYSCDKQYTRYGEPSSDNFWKNESDVQAAVDGMYLMYNEQMCGARGSMYYYLCSDDMVYGRSHSPSANVKNFIYDDGCDVADQWMYAYMMIKRANDIIINVPDAPVTDDVKNNALAEAYFFRAWAYLWLAPCYGDNGENGGIPIVDENTPVDDMDQPRAESVLDNYDMIISDLEKALATGGLKKMSEMDPNQYGRPTIVAAQAYIAKAAIYASQYDQSKYFPIVDQYCDLVIADGERALVQNRGAQASRQLGDQIVYNDLDLGYRRLFSMEENYGSEYIFGVPGKTESQYSGNIGGIMIENKGWGIQNTWGQFTPTYDLYESYEEGDIRRECTITKVGDYFKFLGAHIYYGYSLDPEYSYTSQNYVETILPKADRQITSATNTSGSFFCKYSQPFEDIDSQAKGYIGTGTSSALLTPLIRYAEVLLWKAEVAIWSGGSGDQWINEVRERVNLPALSGATKWDLIRERRSEFAGEYVNRMYDLIRWGEIDGKNVAELYCEPALRTWNVSPNEDGSVDIVEGWAARDYNPSVNHVWPIPTKYISESNTLVQNKGY